MTQEHIKEIQKAYTDFVNVDRNQEEELAAKVFNNEDFGYYKVTVERPERLKAQFTAEKIQELRFDKSLAEPMQYALTTFGEDVYTNITAYADELLKWCEEEDLDLNANKRKALINPKTWTKHKLLFDVATTLHQKIGETEFLNFNKFEEKVNEVVKAEKIKISASEKKQILAAVSSYDENAEKVVKKKVKLTGDKLQNLLTYLSCKAEDLPLYGFYPTGKKDEYTVYETASDLRDTENIPLSESIQDYFLREVKPHVDEAWIDLDKTKIGYEISFNKYFYQHKALRSIEEVSAEILELERKSEGLIAEILNLGV